MKIFAQMGKMLVGMLFGAVLLVVFSNGVEAQTQTCAQLCPSGSSCSCQAVTSCSGTPLGNTTDCTGNITCCNTSTSATPSSSTCNASNCKAEACSSSETENTSCAEDVCTSGQHYCVSNSSSGGTTTTGSAASISLPNPLKYNTVQEVLTALLHALQAVIVTLALVFLVIGAVLYITSAGNQGRLTLAKGAITAALIGLAIGILAPTFLKEIANALGWGSTDIPTEVQNAPTAATILLNILNFLLGIVGVLAIIFLVIGGSMYLGAAGNPSQIDKAKGVVKYSLIGIVVALASLVFVRQIAAFFAGA